MPIKILKKDKSQKDTFIEGSKVAASKLKNTDANEGFKTDKKLTGGQAKLDKNKNNRIDEQDFKILRAEKAKGRGQGLQDEKMKPGKTMKAALGAIALGLGAKKMMEKKGSKMPMGLGAASAIAKKKKEILGRMGGGMMKRPMGYKAGMSIKGDNKRDIRKTESMIGASKSSPREKSIKKRMGGGMMMRPMGYSKGKSVMAKGCKLGRKKPTKMY